MEKNLDHISTREMVEDLIANERDLTMCRFALGIGITHYMGGEPIADAIKLGEKISEKIRKELERRLGSIPDSLRENTSP